MTDVTGYHSRHWNWSTDFCHKHSGFRLPCKWCIATNDPDLIVERATAINRDPVTPSTLAPAIDLATYKGKLHPVDPSQAPPQIDPDYIAYQFGVKSGDLDELQQWI